MDRVEPILDDLIRYADFWVDPDLSAIILREVGDLRRRTLLGVREHGAGQGALTRFPSFYGLISDGAGYAGRRFPDT